MFSSYIKPIFDVDECVRLGLEPISKEVLTKTNITMKQLEEAPSIQNVWQQFIQYVNKYNPSKSRWKAPIKAGYNIDRYDNIIIDRICGGHVRNSQNQLDILLRGGIIDKKTFGKLGQYEPYCFGPWDDERQEETLFYPRDCIDLLRIVWMWTENIVEVKSLSMDAVREWLGISTEGAHNATKDVLDGAKVLIKFLKLHRNYAPKIKFKGSCAKKF